ncbi:TolC family protein [Leptospira johnsonii]|uniref:Outer membrane efflux protein n=1 Tax=Leptospira johnsonii TaxID=1917820 RepID=A0A2P2CZ67_9LEPT|nr:TolC family protein [Leptospira johnsonii]GBF37625.1 outer membrane efflux protein [Leptospira johnsonii]
MNARLIVLISIYTLFSSATYAEKKHLEEILDVIVKEHPESKSLAGLSQAHKSHSEATGILPDPKIGVAFRNYPTRGGYSTSDRALDTPTMTGVELSVSQEFPFPGKLSTEKRISKLMQTEANFAYISGVNRILGDFFSRLNKYKYSEKKKAINERILTLLGAQKSISENSYSYGENTLSGVLKATIAKTEAVEKETEYNTQLKDLKSQLEYYQISDKITFSDLYSIDVDSFLENKNEELETLVTAQTSLIEDSPEYKIQMEEEKRLKEQAKLTKYSLAPQTEVFFSYMKRRSQTFALDQGPLNYGIMDTTEYRGDLFSFGVNMRVPVWSALKWNSITGETEHLAEVGKDSVEKTRVQMLSELNRNLAYIKGVSNQIRLVEKRLIPELEKSVRAGSFQYTSGKVNVQDTLLAQTEILNTKIRLEDLKERKNESILNTLKLLSFIYKDNKTPEHDKHN